MDEVLERLKGHVDSGKRALDHCRFGVGRAGTIIANYLLKRRLSLEHVLEIMKQTPVTPTSRDQRKIIFESAKKLGMDTTETEV